MRGASACLLLTACASSSDVKTEHYLGVFDPQQQVTQELYRIKIRGSAPWYSSHEFGSGWVNKDAADTLTGAVDNDNGAIKIKTDGERSPVRARRRFFEVGPLGVSTAPESHRFTVVMAANPDQFFRMASTIAKGGAEGRSDALADVRREREIVGQRIKDLEGGR